MATSFFIEFRLRGFARQYAIWVEERIHREAKRLRLKHKRSKNFVSHITLFAPAKTKNLRTVTIQVEKTCRKYTLVPFKLGGFGGFLNNDANWLYISVLPSAELDQLRYEMSQNLLKSDRTILDTCKKYDLNLKYKFHSSLGKFDPTKKEKFEQLLVFANNKCRLEDFKEQKTSFFGKLVNVIKKHVFGEKSNSSNIYLHLLRVTVIGKGSRIYREYDLVLRKLLNRKEALSKYYQRKTIDKLKNINN